MKTFRDCKAEFLSALLLFCAASSHAVMNGLGQDIFPVAAVFQASATINYTNAANAGLTVSSGVVVSTGNVGVGIAVPVSRLHVKDGDIRLSTTTGSRSMIFQDNSALASASGMIVNFQRTEVSALQTITTSIPLDDTIPQNTEGEEVATVTITPKKAGNKLVVKAYLMGYSDTGGRSFTAALFQDSGADAIGVGQNAFAGNGEGGEVNASVVVTAAGTAATTFKVRAGMNAGGNLWINGGNSSRFFGGKAVSYIEVWEVMQ